MGCDCVNSGSLPFYLPYHLISSSYIGVNGHIFKGDYK